MDPTGFFLKPEYFDDLFQDDEVRRSRQSQFFPDTYLDSPILLSTRSKWVAGLLGGAVEQPKSAFHKTLNEVIKTQIPWEQYSLLEPENYPEFYHKDWPSTITDELDDACTVAERLYNCVSNTLQTHYGVHLPELPIVLPDHAKYWFSRWSYFDSLVEEFSRISATSGPNVIIIRLSKHTHVVATRDVWFIDSSQHGKYLLTYDQVLMVKDVCYSRAQCFTAAAVFYPDNSEMQQSIHEVCGWHEECLIRHDNPGFELLKQTEALSKAYLSEMTDPIFTVNGPYPRMIEKVKQKEQKMRSDDDNSEYLTDKLDRILRSKSSIQSIVEMFGLLKISGHPLVDPLIGGKSAAKEARDPDYTLFEDAERLDWEFKRNMLISYIRRVGSWPPLDFLPGSPRTELKRLHHKQFRGLNRSSYPLSDWRYCRFKKIEEFDYSPNYLELMDDKAISHYRSEVAATWDSNVKTSSHRRLLMELINRDRFDVKEIVAMIARREVPFDWFIVSLHPKEREFKLAPRMFSMLVLEIRVFFALTEANLADRIFPYLPQQTMTKSKIQISRQFLEMTRPMTDVDSLRMFIEIDLSRWNLRWRSLAVNPVARTLNDMFGVVGVFDFCHEFFAHSMILVRVNDIRPDGIELPHPPESDLLWYNHLGGFEGICQKLWTICTYSMVSLALEPLPLSYILLGQGDNQILSIVLNRDPDLTDTEVLERMRDEVTERVSAMCASVNQEVKPEECVESTSVITYSKDIYVSGVYRPTALKFHSRLFPHSSQIFPSIRTNVGAIFSTAVAGAEKSSTPMSSYYLACLYSALYLLRCSHRRGPYGAQVQYFRRQLKERFLSFVEFCISLPSEAGGFPVIPFIGFIYKGGSDPLGKALSAMVGLGQIDRLHNRMLSQLYQDSIYNKTPKLESLFMDPFSVPFAKPPTSTDGVASITINALTPSVKIGDIRELMGADSSKYLSSLVDILSTARPLNPLIIRDIMDCSIAGITDTVSRMFVATRTLQSVVRETGVPVIGTVLHLESRGLLYMYARFCQLPNNPAPHTTVYRLTQSLRDRWFPQGENPIVGLTTYQPWDFRVEWDATGFKREGFNAVLVAQSDPLETRGPYDPYVGSQTREKRSEHGFKIVGTDTASAAMRKLQLIASQTGDDPNFKTLIDAVGWTRTNTQLSTISNLLPGVSGGTLSHRYAARAGHQDAFNIGSPNFATHCVISSDNTGYLSGGIHDYPIMFQEFLLTSLSLLQMKYTQVRSSFLSLTLITEGSDLDELPSTDIRVDNFVDHRILRFPSNPLAFLPSLRLERVTGAVSHPSLPVADTYEATPELRRQALEAFFKGLLRKQSTGRQIADGALQLFRSATLDIAEVATNGLYLIAQSICNVVLDEAISNYMMTAVLGRTRWNIRTYSSLLVPALVAAVSPYFGHPLLKEDALTRYLSLYDNPSYAGGYSTPHHRYISFVNGLISQALKGGDNLYNHRSIGIFTSDNNHIVSETLLTALLSDCYIWIIRHELAVPDVNTIIGGKLIPTIRAQRDETDKVDTLYHTISRMIQKFRFHSPGVSRTLQTYHGKRIKGYKTTVADILRSTRSTDQWGVPTIPALYRNRELKVRRVNATTHRRHITVDVTSKKTGVRELPATRTTDLGLLYSIYRRNLGQDTSIAGTAMSTWSLFTRYLSDHPIIIVGSGFGAIARVALDAGCPFVHGSDLRESIPMKAHRFRFYKPILVLMGPYEDRYEQIPESFTTSGDWLDPAVSQSILAYDQGNSTVVIDIQSGQRRFGLEVLEPLIGKKLAGRVLIRMYLTHLEIRAVVADLNASACVFDLFQIQNTGDIHQVVICIHQLGEQLNTATRFTTIEDDQVFNELPSVRTDRTIHRHASLSDAVLNMVDLAPTQTSEDLQLELDELIAATKGNYDSRFSYGQWTRMLRAKLSIDWIHKDGDSRWEALEKWYRDRQAFVEIGDKSYRMKFNWEIAYHLVTKAARVCL